LAILFVLLILSGRAARFLSHSGRVAEPHQEGSPQGRRAAGIARNDMRGLDVAQSIWPAAR
jgi:hypothetical protein